MTKEVGGLEIKNLKIQHIIDRKARLAFLE